MSLLYIDGFEHRSHLGRYNGAAGPGFTSPGRFGGYYMTNSTGTLTRYVTASTKLLVGLGIRMSNTEVICKLLGDSGTTEHVRLQRTAAGAIQLIIAGSVVATSPVNSLLPSVWNYLEVSATVSDTVGVVVVRVNNVQVLSFTGDTRNGGTNLTLDAVDLPASFIDFDDWYIANDLGTLNNAFLGDVQVQTLIPTGDGASSALVGSDGDSLSNYLNVDEAPASATDYNGSATVGAKDTYQMADLVAATSAVLGVQHDMYAYKSDAGAGTARPVVRSAGVDYPGTTVGLPTSHAYYQDLRETDPATAALWTVAAVNALQAGMEVV